MVIYRRSMDFYKNSFWMLYVDSWVAGVGGRLSCRLSCRWQLRAPQLAVTRSLQWRPIPPHPSIFICFVVALRLSLMTTSLRIVKRKHTKHSNHNRKNMGRTLEDKVAAQTQYAVGEVFSRCTNSIKPAAKAYEKTAMRHVRRAIWN